MNQYAIVTGASGGIGSAIAIKLAKEGYDLLLIGGRKTDRLTEVCSLCRREGVSATSLQIDFSEPHETEQLLAKLSACDPSGTDSFDLSHRTIDLLVNCAGISHIGLLQDMSTEKWLQIMNINLTSAFTMCRFVIPSMVRAKKGHILNISSVWGSVGASCEVAYSATKGGIHALTRALAKELAPSGISVNVIAGGMIDTAMNHCFTKEEIDDICEEIPAGRMGTPEEIADTTALLAKAPVYLTGQIVGVDGGWKA